MELWEVLMTSLVLTALHLSPGGVTASLDNQTCSQQPATENTGKRKLLYPYKYYESEILSGNISDEVAKLYASPESKWRAYHELQEARLQQWKNKQCKDYAEMPLPFDPVRGQGLTNFNNSGGTNFLYRKVWGASVLTEKMYRKSYGDEVKEMVDEHGMRWLFFLNEGNLVIWNITRVPHVHDTVKIDCWSNDITFLPKENVLLKERNKKIAVYKFAYPDYKLTLTYKTTFLENIDRNQTDPIHKTRRALSFGDIWPISSEVIVGDLLVASDSKIKIHDLKKVALHIWRLSSGEKIAKVPLPIEIIKQYLTYLNITESDYLESKDIDTRNYNVKLFPVSDDVTKLLLVFYSDEGSQINLFNLKTMEVVCTLIQIPSKVSKCHMYADKLCVKTSVDGSVDNVALKIYFILKDASASPTLRIIYEIFTNIFWNDIHFKNNKVILYYGSRVSIVDLSINTADTMSVNLPYCQRVGVDCHLLSFIEPDLLMMYKTPNDTVEVINIQNKETLCVWEGTADFHLSYYEKLVYPSKIALRLGDNLHFMNA